MELDTEGKARKCLSKQTAGIGECLSFEHYHYIYRQHKYVSFISCMRFFSFSCSQPMPVDPVANLKLMTVLPD